MPLSASDFDLVCKLVMANSAIVLEKGKEYLVESRLTPLAQKLGYASLEALIGTLRSDPNNGALRSVIDAMTTNETYFFRDIHPFETIKKTIIPELMTKRSAERSLKVWCGACSSGQEPYTMGLIFKENFPQLATWQVQILATDLCRDILARAKTGFYNQLEMNRGMPAMLLVKYFKKVGDQWQIRDDVRAMIEYQEFNLAKPFPNLPRFDLVLLRNVMIYFDVETKKNILSKIRRVLAPGGYLFLGCAETTLNLDDSYESVTIGKTVCYRLKG